MSLVLGSSPGEGRQEGGGAPTYVVMKVAVALSRVITYKYLLSYISQYEKNPLNLYLI